MSFSAGTFSINTAGQPVVTGTTITVTAFNLFTADVATGLSTCMLKDGTQTATAGIGFYAGTVSLPGVYFGTNTVSGFYLIGANNWGFAVNTAKLLDLGAALVGITGGLTVSTTLGVTGAASFSSVAASSAVVSTLPAGFVLQPLTSTNAAYLSTIVSAGSTFLGTDSSTGATFGTAGNSGAVWWRVAGTQLDISRAGTSDFHISGAGVVTIPSGTLGVTAGIYPGATQTAAALISQASSGAGTTTTYIGNAVITAVSDRRLKTGIVNTRRDALGILDRFRVVDHGWDDPSDQGPNNRNSRGLWMGLIAQEVIEHAPWIVNKPLSDTDAEGKPQYWFMDFNYAVPLLVRAIQQLSERLK